MQANELKQYIIEHDKTPFILESLSCGHIQEHDNYWSASNPDGDRRDAINIYKEDVGYKNWTRNSNGDILNLVMDCEHCDFRSALIYVHKLLDLPLTRSAPKAKKNSIMEELLKSFTDYTSDPVDVAEITVLDEDVFAEYDNIEHISWLREGIVPPICDRFGIMYDYRHKRIVIPWRHWMTGECIGTNARTTIEGYDILGIQKYMFSKGMNKSCTLYGLYENWDYIQKAKSVIVFEAEKSVLKACSLGYNNCVALGSKRLSAEQERVLLGLGVDIIFALDQDVRCEEVLLMCDKFWGVRNSYFIFDKKGLLESKDSPIDRGMDIFDELLNSKYSYNEKAKRKLEGMLNEN